MAKPSPDIRKEERRAAYAIMCRHRPELAGELSFEDFETQVAAVVRGRGAPRGSRMGILYMVLLCKLANDPRYEQEIIQEILGHSEDGPVNRLTRQYENRRSKLLAIAMSRGLVIREGQAGELSVEPAPSGKPVDLKFVYDEAEWSKICEVDNAEYWRQRKTSDR
jgi:hypothetical protein